MKLEYLLGLLVAFAACVTDLRSRRIPNVLTFGATAAALVFHAVTGQASGLLQSVEGWLVGAAIFFLPFALGGLGAGDVKLLAALGAWVGPLDAMWISLYTGVSGGVLALVVAASTGYLRQALSNVWLLLSHWSVAGIRPLHEISLEGSKGPRLAYAIPIFAGTLVNVWLRS
jgi:prepilin peptidase CpaA